MKLETPVGICANIIHNFRLDITVLAYYISWQIGVASREMRKYSAETLKGAQDEEKQIIGRKMLHLWWGV